MQRFHEQVALVVGGGHGIGRAVVERLGDEGASVVVADLDFPAATQVAQQLQASGRSALPVECDLTDNGQVVAMIEAAVERFSQLDVLINAAGGDREHPGFGDTGGTPLYPLDPIGEPEDIAAAVAFLSSNDAAWVTGITLAVDGGLLASGAFGQLSAE